VGALKRRTKWPRGKNSPPYDKKIIIRTKEYVIKNMKKSAGIATFSQLCTFFGNKPHLVSHCGGWASIHTSKLYGKNSIRVGDDSYIVPSLVENLIIESDEIGNPGLRCLSTNCGSYPIIAIKYLSNRVSSSDKPISISKMKGGKQTTALITEDEVLNLKNLDKKIPLTLHQAIEIAREEAKIFSELAILDGAIKRLPPKHSR